VRSIGTKFSARTTQSPFNVGLPVELGEFPADQVRHMVELHGLNLSEEEQGQLLELVGSHPYLVRKALCSTSSAPRSPPTNASPSAPHTTCSPTPASPARLVGSNTSADGALLDLLPRLRNSIHYTRPVRFFTSCSIWPVPPGPSPLTPFHSVMNRSRYIPQASAEYNSQRLQRSKAFVSPEVGPSASGISRIGKLSLSLI
jgi:hypothetical protein